MGVHLLSFKADLENVETLHFPADHAWVLGFRDENADERRNVVLCTSDSVEIPGSRGSANLLLKFPAATTPAAISVAASDKHGTTAYTKSGEFQPILAVECRGAQPFEWTPTGFYVAHAPSGTTFDQVDLQDGDWCDFDADADCSVGVFNVAWKWERTATR